jgi:hypothetical protein
VWGDGCAGMVDCVDRIVLGPSAHRSGTVDVVCGRMMVLDARGCVVDGQQVWVWMCEDGGAYLGPWYIWVPVSPRSDVVDVVNDRLGVGDGRGGLVGEVAGVVVRWV